MFKCYSIFFSTQRVFFHFLSRFSLFIILWESSFGIGSADSCGLAHAWAEFTVEIIVYAIPSTNTVGFGWGEVSSLTWWFDVSLTWRSDSLVSSNVVVSGDLN